MAGTKSLGLRNTPSGRHLNAVEEVMAQPLGGGIGARLSLMSAGIKQGIGRHRTFKALVSVSTGSSLAGDMSGGIEPKKRAGIRHAVDISSPFHRPYRRDGLYFFPTFRIVAGMLCAAMQYDSDVTKSDKHPTYCRRKNYSGSGNQT
jgi:hypothetical protein